MKGGDKIGASIPNFEEPSGVDVVLGESVKLMTSTSILVCCWLLEELELPHNLVTLLNEATSLRAIGVKLKGCMATKKTFVASSTTTQEVVQSSWTLRWCTSL